MAATWGTPTTWADFLTWAGDTAPSPTTQAGGGNWIAPPPRYSTAYLDDDLLIIG